MSRPQRTTTRTPSPRCPQCSRHEAELVETDVKLQTTSRGREPWLLSTWQCAPACGRRWVTH